MLQPNMFSSKCSLFICLLCSVYANGSIDIFDKFRLLFGNVPNLQTFHIDQITSELLNQAECNKRIGLDCYNVMFKLY